MTINQLAKNSSDLVAGYRLCITMQPRVPLYYLRRHREFAVEIPEGEANSANPYYIWLPELNSEYDFLSEGATMASSVGYIPDDGGTFLPFLIALREILERPRDLCLSDYQDALLRAEDILQLRMPDSTKYLENLYGSSRERLLGFVIREVTKTTHDGLKLEHLEELSSKGYSSISDMIDADDSVLLSLNGIGPAKLAKIRSNKQEANKARLGNPH